MTTTAATTSTHELVHVAPGDIVLEVNVRKDLDLSPAFIASLKQHGVQTPIKGYRNSDNQVVARAGQRRILGALKAGLATVPVYLVDPAEDAVTRITEQVTENLHREGLSSGDFLAAVGDLALLDLTAADIAKRLAAPKEHVKNAIAAARSHTAVAVANLPGADLTKLAIIAEFDDDEAATARLVETLEQEPDDLEHEAQRIRDERTRETNRQLAIAELTANGIKVIAPEDITGAVVRLSSLRTAEGEWLTPETHTECPGHAATVTNSWYNPDAQVAYWCADPEANGHTLPSMSAAKPELSGEEKTEQRREVIRNNREWASAETVRRAWVTEFLSRKTLPTDAKLFATVLIARADYDAVHNWGNGDVLAHEFLRLERSGYGAKSALLSLLHSQPTKCDKVLLAIALDTHETSLSKLMWRDSNEQGANYLAQLARWGYKLSDVERIVTTAHSVDVE